MSKVALERLSDRATRFGMLPAFFTAFLTALLIPPVFRARTCLRPRLLCFFAIQLSFVGTQRSASPWSSWEGNRGGVAGAWEAHLKLLLDTTVKTSAVWPNQSDAVPPRYKSIFRTVMLVGVLDYGQTPRKTAQPQS